MRPNVSRLLQLTVLGLLESDPFHLPMRLEVTNYPCRKRENAFRAVKDEGGLVVIPTKSEVKVLNPVASKIYSMLDGSHSIEAIVEMVTAEFEVVDEQARQDVEQFLAELSTEGLLDDSPDAGGG